jgi:hypothetical protein
MHWKLNALLSCVKGWPWCRRHCKGERPRESHVAAVATALRLQTCAIKNVHACRGHGDHLNVPPIVAVAMPPAQRRAVMDLHAV